MDAAREALAELLFDRVAADPALPNEAGELVLAAFDGSTELAQALAGALGDRPIPVRDRPEPTQVPGIYLRSISVAGFRGIGPQAQLNLRPGPGLTIVTGRNGSGKSSFAEAVELTLTGQNKRWSDRPSVVWQSGWRNLHQPTGTAREVELVVDGVSEPMMVARTWAGTADLDDAVATAQVRRQPQRSLAELGWDQALATAEKRLAAATKRLDEQVGVAKKPTRASMDLKLLHWSRRRPVPQVVMIRYSPCPVS